MSTKYIAKHDGHTWTRKTANRKYTHAVISKRNIADERVSTMKSAARMFEVNKAYNQEILAGGGHLAPYSAEYLAELKARMEAGPVGAAEDAGQKFDEYSKKFKLASDGVSYYSSDAAWAGRPDLAQKNAGLGDIILEVKEVV